MKRQRGFSFLEVLVALVIASILGTISVWAFGSSAPDCSNPTVKQNPLMRAKIAEISGDLGQIHMALSRYELSHGRYPATLAEAGVGNLTDSWGNPYWH